MPVKKINLPNGLSLEKFSECIQIIEDWEMDVDLSPVDLILQIFQAFQSQEREELKILVKGESAPSSKSIEIDVIKWNPKDKKQKPRISDFSDEELVFFRAANCEEIRRHYRILFEIKKYIFS